MKKKELENKIKGILEKFETEKVKLKIKRSLRKR